MVNNEDGALRTLAQKNQATNNEDAQLMTLAEKAPAAPGGFAHSQAMIIG